MIGALLWMAFVQAETPRRGVDPECQNVAKPAGYNESVQQAFLLNQVSLAASWSGVHGPRPHPEGGSILGLQLSGIPPLDCDHRFAQNHTKTENTNISPVLPRLAATLSLPSSDWDLFPESIQPWVDLGVLPPVQVRGQHITAASGAMGLGASLGDRWLVGLSGHMTLMRVIGDTALKIEKEGADWRDLYIGSTTGLNGMVGWSQGGREDLQVFFRAGVLGSTANYWVGDDRVMIDNPYPYRGPELGLGLGRAKEGNAHLYWGIELYAAPGGHWNTPLPQSEEPSSSTGRMVTIRILVGRSRQPSAKDKKR
jgi:hypothetical protein